MKIAFPLFTRVRDLLALKQVQAPVAPPTARTRDPVAQAYVRFGPRVARHVARSAREKAPSEEPSRWAWA